MDLPATILEVTDDTRELALEELFCRRAPLEVEIGCGKGRFLTATAMRLPERNFIGIDRQLSRIRKVDRKIARAGLTNVRLLWMEAAHTARHLLPAGSVSVFDIFFPDPWPKHRHHRRRLFNEEFLDTLHRALVTGGRIHFATDYLEYRDAVCALFSRDPRFCSTEAFVPPEEAVSEFEQVFRAQNKPIGRASFQAR